MADVDFISAFARLLHSGELRDAFVADRFAVAATLGIEGADRARLLQLDPDELEFQAGVLWRKRFEIVREALPRTVGGLGRNAWSEFARYARPRGPMGPLATAQDCYDFCSYLLATRIGSVDAAEFNRAEFAWSRRRAAVYWVQDLPIRGIPRAGFQFFWSSKRRAHEWRMAWGL